MGAAPRGQPPGAAGWSAQSQAAAITRNMLIVGMVKNGAITFAYPEDAKRNLIVQRKQ